jgi:hypothetical protein
LQDSLTNALSIIKGKRIPWDELSDSDSDSGSDPGVAEADTEGLQGDTELKQLFARIQNSVTCLFRMAIAIRQPAAYSQLQSTITIDKSHFEAFDKHHVRSKFRDCPEYLADRLGRAVSYRRHYLSYREQHHSKLAKNVESIGFEEPRTEHTTNSTEASPIPLDAVVRPALGTSAAVLPTLDTVMDDGQDALSQTSYANSVNDTLRVPPLPREAREKEHFECPLCFMIVSIHTKAAWK